jgi:hypothetical protein
MLALAMLSPAAAAAADVALVAVRASDQVDSEQQKRARDGRISLDLPRSGGVRGPPHGGKTAGTS